MPAHQRQVTCEEMQQWCQENAISSYMETSSKKATNVTEAFVLAVRHWKQLEKQAEAEVRAQNEAIILSKPLTLVQNGQCCSGAPNDKFNNNTDDDYMENHRKHSSPKRFGFPKLGKKKPSNFHL